ncbi:MAG: chromate efflux transporter [Planctomycetaceae bacterium]|nr:chromate efflux transporter [Planctomycetaceae bacterium]
MMPKVSFVEAFWVWCRVAMLSFGGPAGQIAVMHRILVEEKKWISESQFLHALNYCMLLPGPEAQQLSVYIGWLLHRTWGGIVAGTLFILPGFLSILALSILYTFFREVTIVQGLLYGLKPAIIAVVIMAALRVGQRSLQNKHKVAIAMLAFICILVFKIPFPVIILAAGLFGLVAVRIWPENWKLAGHATARQPILDVESEAALNSAVAPAPSWLGTTGVVCGWLAVWWLPIGMLAVCFGADSIFVQEALFFSKAAMVTFGGAYSVLAYIAQECVETYRWLEPGEMLDGMGMAESTPGPLIQVVQFVGYLGAYRNPGSLHPLTAAIVGSIVTTWVTFAPCFLWVFAGAPYIERLRGNEKMNGIMSAISAAVVGVIVSLAIWFSLNTLFAKVSEVSGYGFYLLVPVWSSFDPAAAVIATCAFGAIFRYKVGLITTLLCSVVAGALYYVGVNIS